jgi:hypothetical protein
MARTAQFDGAITLLEFPSKKSGSFSRHAAARSSLSAMF